MGYFLSLQAGVLKEPELWCLSAHCGGEGFGSIRIGEPLLTSVLVAKI
jgi:hypothetical protein